MVICIVSDGKKGHLSQTRGLANALIRQASKLHPGNMNSVHEVDVAHLSLLEKMRYTAKGLGLPKPDLVLCAGHGTHLAALSLARSKHCLCIVCMKPSLPVSLFDLCITPQHDYTRGNSAPSNVLLTRGAVNSVVPSPDSEKRDTLVLIGGPSRDFGWDEDHLITQLSTLVRYNNGQITLTTSRRTPGDFVDMLHASCPSIRVVPVDATSQDWVAEHLSTAKDVWVTQDSVSMVYEALTSGAPVGILEMPVNPKRAGKAPGRVSRGLAQLVDESLVTTFTQWLTTRELTACEPLHEADRAANYILEHFPTLLS